MLSELMNIPNSLLFNSPRLFNTNNCSFVELLISLIVISEDVRFKVIALPSNAFDSIENPFHVLKIYLTFYSYHKALAGVRWSYKLKRHLKNRQGFYLEFLLVQAISKASLP